MSPKSIQRRSKCWGVNFLHFTLKTFPPCRFALQPMSVCFQPCYANRTEPPTRCRNHQSKQEAGEEHRRKAIAVKEGRKEREQGALGGGRRRDEKDCNTRDFCLSPPSLQVPIQKSLFLTAFEERAKKIGKGRGDGGNKFDEHPFPPPYYYIHPSRSKRRVYFFSKCGKRGEGGGKVVSLWFVPLFPLASGWCGRES